ncbi:hypothetical protein CAI21_07090 [Alkalilimnicola ehrlichii]|nr:hypothetical protein CAI21_07090 [Alkalilimnicola ehrlichii]
MPDAKRRKSPLFLLFCFSGITVLLSLLLVVRGCALRAAYLEGGVPPPRGSANGQEQDPSIHAFPNK